MTIIYVFIIDDAFYTVDSLHCESIHIPFGFEITDFISLKSFFFRWHFYFSNNYLSIFILNISLPFLYKYKLLSKKLNERKSCGNCNNLLLLLRLQSAFFIARLQVNWMIGLQVIKSGPRTDSSTSEENECDVCACDERVLHARDHVEHDKEQNRTRAKFLLLFRKHKSISMGKTMAQLSEPTCISGSTFRWICKIASKFTNVTILAMWCSASDRNRFAQTGI